MYRNSFNESLLNKEGVFVLTYYLIYLTSVAIFPKLESANWISLVFLPLLLLYIHQKKSLVNFSVKLSLASFGIKRYNLSRGLNLALIAGIITGILLLLYALFQNRTPTRNFSVSLLYILPLSLILIVMTTSVIEEFFFRGVLMARLARLLRNNVFSIFLTACLFGLYHTMFALIDHSFFQYLYTHVSLIEAFTYGFVIGTVSGMIYSSSGENLLASILFNSLSCLPLTALYLMNNYF